MRSAVRSQLVYKVCSESAWIGAQVNGELEPSPVDVRDGYVHLSATHQVQRTVEKHFAAAPDLILLSIPVERLPPGALRWELSRGDERFPHLYAPLRFEYVAEAVPLPLGADGRHAWPPGF